MCAAAQDPGNIDLSSAGHVQLQFCHPILHEVPHVTALPRLTMNNRKSNSDSLYSLMKFLDQSSLTTPD